MHRVLIANRGEIAHRLIRYFKEQGVETVAVFSEPDAEQPWLDEADYATYLNGRTVEETYKNPRKVLEAALDSGCEVVHPGYCFLAERHEFFHMCAMANVSVVGASPEVLAKVVDRSRLQALAEAAGVPVLPASRPLEEGDDGIEQAAYVGLPLFVKAVSGGALERVERIEEVPEVVARVGLAAAIETGDGRVYLERALAALRHLGTRVVRDQHGTAVHLGTAEGSLQYRYRTWIEEAPAPGANAALRTRLGEAAVRLAEQADFVGLANVRWGLTKEGNAFLLGFSPRITTGYTLSEQVLGIDLVDAQLQSLLGTPLGWSQSDVAATRHGIQIRLLHGDPTRGMAREEGVLERLDVPEGVTVDVGAHVGQPCTPDTDPLLCKITITAPTRGAAVVRARAVLDSLRVEGVPTNRELLIQVLGDEAFWRGEYDVRTLESHLG